MSEGMPFPENMMPKQGCDAVAVRLKGRVEQSLIFDDTIVVSRDCVDENGRLKEEYLSQHHFVEWVSKNHTYSYMGDPVVEVEENSSGEVVSPYCAGMGDQWSKFWVVSFAPKSDEASAVGGYWFTPEYEAAVLTFNEYVAGQVSIVRLLELYTLLDPQDTSAMLDVLESFVDEFEWGFDSALKAQVVPIGSDPDRIPPHQEHRCW